MYRSGEKRNRPDFTAGPIDRKSPNIYRLGNLREYLNCIVMCTIYFTTTFTRCTSAPSSNVTM